jgi:predicted O-methyltransferase YrrM
MAYTYSQDWFDRSIPLMEQLKANFGQPKRILEIGSFEGRSTVWFATHLLADGGEICCVDTWEGGEEHKEMGLEMPETEKTFDNNMFNLQIDIEGRNNVTKQQGTSVKWLAEHIRRGSKFDFIYVDGSHTAPDVLTDLCMSWQLLDVNGIMVMDDYLWGDARDALHRPKLAIDAFVNTHSESLAVVAAGYQFAVRRMK